MKAKIWNKKGFYRLNYFKNNELKKRFSKMLKQSGFTILHFHDYYFKPIGYSAIWLLAESHFTIHTFPEEKKVYIELSSCNYQYYKNFIKLFRKIV